MSPDPLDRPGATPALCRPSFDAPCSVEARLADASRDQSLKLARALHDELANQLTGSVQCLAAVRSRVAAIDPSLARQLDELDAQVGEAVDRGCDFACSASRFVAAHHGLGAALRMRFRGLAPPEGAACELILQLDAEQGLSVEEQTTLLRVAEEAVAQVMREGSREVRVMLRRSRLGSVELSIGGGGGVASQEEVAASFRCLATIRRLAARIEGRLSVRRQADGSLFVRCATRWPEGETGRWVAPR